MATNETEMEEPQYDDANEEEKEEQEPKPKKEKVPDEPPPDGEGELGPPMKRVYFIGGGLGIWGICAVWLMIYWLASAVDPCRYEIRTETCYALDQLDDCEEDGYSQCEAFYSQEAGFGGKSLTSAPVTPAPVTPAPIFVYYYYDPVTPSPTSDTPTYISYSTVVGPYFSIIDPDTVSNGREYFNEIYAYEYFGSSWAIRMVAWLVLTFGIGLTFFGIVCSYFAVKSGKGCYKAMAYILVGLGAALTIVGGVLLTASWDYERFEDITPSEVEDINNAMRATQLGEFLFVGVIGIIFAIDLQRLLLNDQEKRLMALSIPTAVIGLYLGGCYAYILNWTIDSQPACDNDRLPNRLLRNEFGCISAGYFIFAVGCILGLLVAKEKISLNPAKATLYKLIICILIVGGGFICAVGYWAFIDKTFDYDNECFVCDGNPVCSEEFHYVAILSGLYADYVQPSLFDASTVGSSYDVKYEGQFKAFYVGFSMFVFLLTAAIAYDMEIVGNYQKVRAAQGGDRDEYAD